MDGSCRDFIVVLVAVFCLSRGHGATELLIELETCMEPLVRKYQYVLCIFRPINITSLCTAAALGSLISWPQAVILW